MEVIKSGKGPYKFMDPDEMRAWVREKKSRKLKSKVMTCKEAVEKFVKDSDYVSWDFSSFTRGPNIFIREIIRQKRKDLWVAAKFTLIETPLLVAGGCVKKIDVGFAGLGRSFYGAIERGEVETIDYSNGTMALRHLAGAMGIPFLPTWELLATDSLEHSGAKVVKDPFTGRNICLVPAINPDVALFHVHQCDEYGNARVFGPSVCPMETVLSSKRVLISTEEIIPHEEIRREPGHTTIPYYAVDAVVEAPFGAWPGCTQGIYFADVEHILHLLSIENNPEKLQEYLDYYIYSVDTHEEMLEKRVGLKRLLELKRQEKIKEGFSA